MLRRFKEDYVREFYEMHCSNMRLQVKTVDYCEHSHRVRNGGPQGNDPVRQ
jgi:hypothetical protein